MDIRQLDLTNERLVLEALAIHCTCPLEWGGDLALDSNGVAENLAKLDAHYPKTIFYLQDHNRIVGIYWLEVPVRRRGFIRSLWVDPAYRLAGIATRMKQLGDAWFAEHDVRSVETIIDVKNALMMEKYRELGFVQKGDSFVKVFEADRVAV